MARKATTKKVNPFDGFDAGDVPEFDQQVSRPSIGYNSQSGQFYISITDGEAQDGWSMSDEGDNWIVEEFTLVPLAKRERVIIEDSHGTKHYYPRMTRKTDMVEGKFSSHIQIACHIPGFDEVYILGLRRMTATVSWNNPGMNSQYHRDKFPVGVETTMVEYVKAIRKEHEIEVPLFLAWEITLGGTPKTITVGSGQQTSKVYPFQIVGEPKFVGQETYNEMLSLFKAEKLDEWMQEWASASVEESDSNSWGSSGFDDDYDEEDEIPF